MADGSLRCFASLADRYTRRGIDPAPLAQHGLVDELLARLRAVGQPGTGPAAAGAGGCTAGGGGGRQGMVVERLCVIPNDEVDV